MARPLRILFADAHYHVTRKATFSDDTRAKRFSLPIQEFTYRVIHHHLLTFVAKTA